MAINTKIAADIAFKRLAGNKSFTTPSRTVFQETIGSNIQASADMLFGEGIPASPGNTKGIDLGGPRAFNTTASNAASIGVVQLIEFDLVAEQASVYDADASPFGSSGGSNFDSADSGTSNVATSHSFALRFPSDYNSSQPTDAGNPKVNSNGFSSSAFVKDFNNVQIVPALYGNDYTPTIVNAAGTNLNASSNDQEFYLDTFAGVLVRQDGNNDTDDVPHKVHAYVYIGKMVSESLGVADIPTLQSVTDSGNTTTNSLEVSNDVNITGSLIVTSSAGSTDTVDFSGINNTKVKNFNATGNADVDGNLNVDGNTQIDGTLTVDGNVILGNAASDTVKITGDLIVEGSTTSISTTDLVVEDKFILLASSSAANSTATSDDGGIIVQRGINSSGNAVGTALFYDADRAAWAINKASGSVTDAGEIDTLPSHTSTGDLGGELNIITVDIQSGAPQSTGGSVNRPRPLIGSDTGNFNLGQMFVDTTDNTGDGGLYIYLP